jgi:cytochrome c551/c552
MPSKLRGRLRRLAGVATLLAGLAAGGSVVAADELDLAIRMGCISCHRGARVLVGPPWREVAARYAGRADAIPGLSDHIIRGTGPEGQGWMKEGRAALPAMPANERVTAAEAARLAAWILQIRDEIPGLQEFVTTRLRIGGNVRDALDLSVEQLRALPAADFRELALATQSLAKTAATERLRGVPLKTLLERAVIVAPGRHDLKKTVIVARASDDYAVVFSWNEIFNTAIGDGVLVVLERDGQPLGEEEGRIALVSAQDIRRGSRHVRWLNAIEVRKIAD